MTAPVRHVLVVAAGDPPDRAELDAAWPGWDAGVDRVIAVDGGATTAATLGLRVDAWVGDGDSLGSAAVEDLRRSGVAVAVHPSAKDETDAELGLRAAASAGAGRVTLLGALGGPRFDHALANALLPAAALRLGLELVVLDGRTRLRHLAADDAAGPARLTLDGRPGDLVSLIAVEPSRGVRTSGLRFPLAGEDLPVGPTRGVSNVRIGTTATVELRAGRLLVIEVPATLGT